MDAAAQGPSDVSGSGCRALNVTGLPPRSCEACVSTGAGASGLHAACPAALGLLELIADSRLQQGSPREVPDPGVASMHALRSVAVPRRSGGPAGALVDTCCGCWALTDKLDSFDIAVTVPGMPGSLIG